MATSLRIAAWNANGLLNHVQEITLFLNINKIDILLISESHSTERTVIKIPYYTVYHANHPDGTAHGGSAIIIKSTLKHYVLQPYITNKIQSTILKLEVLSRPMTIAAIYSPPRHTISRDEYQEYFLTLGSHFITAGDWNAKHISWGSRLTTPKGRNLLNIIEQNNLNILSTGEPTYWPTDINKIPDLLDFAVTKGISEINTLIESNQDLSSDHSPVIITLSTNVIWKKPPPRLCTKNTDWKQFQDYINDNIRLDKRLKDNQDIEETTQYLTKLIQDAAWEATPERHKAVKENHNIPLHIRELVNDKRKARRRWHLTRNPIDKTHLNRLTHKLSSAIQAAKNETFKSYITNLSPVDHSLWKATKKFKRPIVAIPPIRKPNGTWARSNIEKANEFAEYLVNVYTTPQINNNYDAEIESYLNAPCQLSPPIKPFSPNEIRKEIGLLNSRKAPGYDLIVGDILKNLPKKAIVLLTNIYNSMLRLCYFPIQWKYAQIIMIAKPGKPPTETNSYRPISLLPVMSKVFERLILNRIEEILPVNNLIPDHQFGFRHNHSTIQQCHRIVNKIKQCLEEKKMCASVFLDVQQAFDKVWHQGLLYKLKIHLPDQLYLILKSYLSDRYFQVKLDDVLSDYHQIKSGVPQGSVLGPFLYLIFTGDVPVTNDTLMATFADDTAILSPDSDPVRASEKLQNHLNLLQNWLDNWKIRVNTNKSTQITFTTRRGTCPQVSINNAPIPVKTEVKYLGLHLDQKLTWKTHIKMKRRQLDLKVKNMHWLINKKSQLSLENKLILYKIILKPVWTYGIELWGTSKPSNTKILQTFQSKTLRMIADAPWYVSNQTLHNDFNIPFINDVIRSYSIKHKNRSTDHSNQLINELFNQPLAERRLRRLWPEDLAR